MQPSNCFDYDKELERYLARRLIRPANLLKGTSPVKAS